MNAKELFKQWLGEEARSRPSDAEALERVLRRSPRGRALRWAAAVSLAGGAAAAALVSGVFTRAPVHPDDVYLYVNDVGAPESSALVIQLEAPPEKP